MTAQQLYIAGQWVATSETATIVDRWSGEEIAQVALAEASHALAAVDAASAALDSGFPVHLRVSVLRATAELLEARREEAARLITAEMGKPIASSRVEVQRAISVFQLSAEEAMRLPTESMNLEGSAAAEGLIAYTLPMPLGIVAAITPFNFPLNLVAHKIAPAFAAGCPVVLKPSDKGRLVAGLLTELLIEAGLPTGYLNLVTGPAQVVVPEWLADDRVALVNFTGSSKIGWQLKADSPKKHHVLELGSNTAVIIDDDSDIETAAAAAAGAAMANSGQVCISLQRVYVHHDIIDAFSTALAAAVEALPVGDPHDERTVVGPLVSDDNVDRLEEWIADAQRCGGTVVTGGGRVDSKVLAPTVIVNPGADARLLHDEAFGPVVVVSPFGTLQEAIDAVNSADYGLNASIYTNNLAHAMQFTRGVEAGTAMVNMPPNFRSDQMPYGGVKDSGQGREGIPYAVAEMLTQKLVLIKA